MRTERMRQQDRRRRLCDATLRVHHRNNVAIASYHARNNTRILGYLSTRMQGYYGTSILVSIDEVGTLGSSNHATLK